MGREDADGYVRIKLDVDTSDASQVEKALKDTEEYAKIAKRKLDALKDAGIDESAQAYREAAADLEKYNKQLEKYRQAKGEAAKAPELDVTVKKDLDEVKKLAPKNALNLKNTGDFDSISDQVEDYETRLRMLRNKGYGPGDEHFDELYIAWKNASDAEKEYLSGLEKLTGKGVERETEKARKEAESQQRAAEAQKKREDAEKRRQEAAARKQEEINRKQEEATQKEAEQAAEYERLNRLRADAQVRDKDLVKLLERQEEITARMAELKRAGVGEGYKEYDSLSQQLKDVNSSINECRGGFEKAEKSGKKTLDTLNKSTKKSSGLFGALASRLKGLALSLLIFNWISKGFNAMVSLMKEGFNNLASYSKQYNSTMSAFKSSLAELKNNLAAAFEPVVNTVVPYLTRMVNGLNTAIEAISKFMAYMGGKSTYTRAKKQLIDYKNTVDSTNKSLADFDKLHVLDNNTSSGGEKTGADAFETVDLGEVPDSFKKFKELYESYVQPTLDKFKEALTWFGGKAGDVLKHIFSDIADGAGKLWDSIVNLCEAASPYMSAFSENIQRLFTILFEMLTAIWDTIGEPIFGFIVQVLQSTIDYFAAHVGEMSDAFQNFVDKVDADWQKLQPILQEVSENSKRLFSTLLESLATIWDTIGRPIFKFIVLVLQETIDFFVNHVGDMSDEFEKFVNGVEDCWENYLRPALKAIGTFLDEVLLPAFNAAFENGILPAVWDVFIAICDLINDTFIPAFDGICEFLEGVFTLDFEKALNGIKNIVRGIINGIIAIVEGGANLVIDGINAIIGGWNSIASKLHVPEIDLVGKVSLPKLQDDGNWSMSSKNNTTRNYNSETGRIYGGHRVSSDSGGSVYYGNAQTGYKSSDLTSWKNNNNLSNDVKSGSRIGENNTYTFVAQLDGKTIYKEVVNQDKMQKNRTGRSALSD